MSGLFFAIRLIAWLCCVALIAVTCIFLYCLVRNSARFDKERNNAEQEEFLKHHKR